MTNASPTLERARSGVPEYCVWRIAGGITLKANVAAMERLEREALECFRATARRGSEIGGVLLGHVSEESLTVTVEDYEAIPCSYSRGPLYQLSGNDEQRFGAACAQPRAALRVVGFVRSNTRKELALDGEDIALLSRCPAGSLALLLKPFSTKPCAAGWFFREGGFAAGKPASIEFDIRRARPGPPQVEPAPGGCVVSGLQALEQAMEPPPAARPVPPARRRRVIVILAAALAAGAYFFAFVAARPPAPPPVAGSLLDLKAERDSGQWRLSWNRSAPVVVSAGKAVLTILDGPHKQDLEIDPAQLRSGSLVYAAMTGDVTFRLEVMDVARGRSVAESLRALGGRPSPLGPPADPPPPRRAEPAQPARAAPAEASTSPLP